MSKCDYDAIFYRVFCVSLLVIAFIFTVILTNVFVDIDGLLSKKEKAKSNQLTQPNEDPSVTLLREPKHAVLFKEVKNYEDTEDGYKKDVYVNEEETYRNKRSLEARNFMFHLKNPRVKNILTDHLNTLLEQMDVEEFNSNGEDQRRKGDTNEELKTNKEIDKDTKITHNTHERNNEEKSTNNVDINNEAKSKQAKATEKIKDIENKSKTDEKIRNEMLHLAMHDILLQGIIGHMDLSEVYNKFNILNTNFQNKFSNLNGQETSKQDVTNQMKPVNEYNIEGKFIEEMIKCKDLQHQIQIVKENKEQAQSAVTDKTPELLVKTLIDISSVDQKPQNRSLNEKRITGVFKLTYNGKPVKVKVSSEEVTSTKAPEVKIPKTTTEPVKILNGSINDTSKNEDNTLVKLNIPQSYLNTAIANYLKNHSKSKRSIKDRRYKRHVKIHYDSRNKTKSEDDELYVEIETHFDSKGLKGEKRKKMIRTLVEKIEKAIHSNIKNKNKTKKHYHAHVKKRIQNPLIFGNTKTVVVKKVSPIAKETFELRHVDPIIKPEPLSTAIERIKHDVLEIDGKSGEIWKKQYTGPGFLAPSKALNSAEMSEVDVDYNRVMTFNGIPQRLQKPLNSENSDESMPTNYYDLGNLKFFVKDMDGSGISVGFNQYTDEEPDPETIKIFTGVDNLVKVYNHNYEQPGTLREVNAQAQNTVDFENSDIIHSGHTVIRRSADEDDYHSNEYKMIYDTNFLPYDSYKEIFEGIDMKAKHNLKQSVLLENATQKPIAIDILKKKLKPSEIFSLANLLENYRKKRSITIQKYSNIKSRRKLNKFLQTKPSKLFINKKRMKRHIDKIRIIATDKNSNSPKQSDENIFIVSNEDETANRAVIREVLHPSNEAIEERIVGNDKMSDKVEEVYNYNQNTPINFNQMYNDNLSANKYITHIFDGRSRHNTLMSKYPQVFMEEISKSKDGEFGSTVYGSLSNVMANMNEGYNMDQYDMPVPGFATTTPNYMYIPYNATQEDLFSEPITKTKYKLSVKIVPKNLTEMKSGFKEIHTSINKSYDKDGLRFYSLVNVSEISKIEDLEEIKNKSKINTANLTTTTTAKPTINPHLRAQQMKMKSLLSRHKQMIDLQLEHFKKEKERVERLIVNNQNDSDEIFDIKIPGESQPLHMKKSDISKLVASVLRSEQQKTTTRMTTTTRITTTYATTTPVPTTTPTATPAPCTTPAPTSLAQTKGPDVRLINVIEKNGKLTKEILNKIDKNTKTLETFLVKLLDRIDRHPPPLEHKENIDNVHITKPNDVKIHPSKDEFSSKHTKNESNFALPFIYAYQHLYVNPDKTSKPGANMLYHTHVHSDNSQIANEVMNVNPNIVIPKVQKAIPMKAESKGRFFIDGVMSDGFKGSPVSNQVISVTPNNVTKL